MESETFGTLLRRHRLTNGFSQEHLAELAALSAVAISALERGQRRGAQRQTVALLADALFLDAAQREQFEAAAAAGRGRSGSALKSESPAGNNLPHELTQLIGRDREIAELGVLLEARDFRMTSIVGPGGFGKTTLAIRVARNVEASFAHDVWFADLTAIAPGDADAANRIASGVAAVLEIRERAGESMVATLLAALRARRLLLVLDNCEHLLDGVSAFAAQLLRACPGANVLATSRAPLRIGGERVYHLSPLAKLEASMLFSARANAAGHMVTDEAAEAAIVREIVARLDGNPLAIELAAASLQSMTLRGLADGLENRFRLLIRGNRDAPARHQTLRSLVDWSYDNLSGSEQLMLRCLAVFYGGCSEDAAGDVFIGCGGAAEDALDILGTLVEHSLLTVRSDGRYMLLETIQSYALEKLATAGEQPRAARAHMLHFRRLAGDSNDAWLGLDETGRWFDGLYPELANFRAALSWAIDNDPITGARLLAALGKYFRFVSPTERDRWAGALSAALPASTPPDVVADLGFCFQTSGSADIRARAVVRLESALDTYTALGMEKKRGITLGLLCATYFRAGRFDDAENAVTEYVTIARRAGDRTQLAIALTNKGAVWRDEPEREAAMAEAKTLRPEDPIYELYGHYIAELKRGDHAAARSHVRSAIDHLERWPSIYTSQRAALLHDEGWRSLSLDDLDDARETAVEALRLSVQIGNLEMIAESLYFMATVAAYDGDYEVSQQLFAFAEPRVSPRSDRNAGDIPLIDEARERAQSAIAEGRRDELRAAGERLSEADAVTLALSLAPL